MYDIMYGVNHGQKSLDDIAAALLVMTTDNNTFHCSKLKATKV